MNLWDKGLEEKFLKEIELPNELDELKKQVAKDKCEFFLKYLDYKLDKDIINSIWDATLKRVNQKDLLDYFETERFSLGSIVEWKLRDKKYKKIKGRLLIYFEYVSTFKKGVFIEKLFIVEDKWKVAAYNIEKFKNV